MGKEDYYDPNEIDPFELEFGGISMPRDEPEDHRVSGSSEDIEIPDSTDVLVPDKVYDDDIEIEIQEDEDEGHEIQEYDEETVSKFFKRTPSESLKRIMSDPQKMQQSFSMSEYQVQNIQGIIMGKGANLGRQHLSNLIGPELAGGVGGILGMLISKKLTKR